MPRLCFRLRSIKTRSCWSEYPDRKQSCRSCVSCPPRLVFVRFWIGVAHSALRRDFPACWTDVRGMASAVFEGTSLVNMFVRDCWVNGIRRLIISQRGEEEDFFEIRTEWSDRNILYLHRSYSDLGRLFKRLAESFPEDRRDLSKSPLIEGWYWREILTDRDGGALTPRF